MTNQLFEAALGIKASWYVQGVDFDTAKRQLTIVVDFVAGSRFASSRCPHSDSTPAVLLGRWQAGYMITRTLYRGHQAQTTSLQGTGVS